MMHSRANGKLSDCLSQQKWWTYHVVFGSSFVCNPFVKCTSSTDREHICTQTCHVHWWCVCDCKRQCRPKLTEKEQKSMMGTWQNRMTTKMTTRWFETMKNELWITTESQTMNWSRSSAMQNDVGNRGKWGGNSIPESKTLLSTTTTRSSHCQVMVAEHSCCSDNMRWLAFLLCSRGGNKINEKNACRCEIPRIHWLLSVGHIRFRCHRHRQTILREAKHKQKRQMIWWHRSRQTKRTNNSKYFHIFFLR